MNKKEDKITRLNLILRTIRNVHSLLIKERDINKLLKRICQNLIKNRGYYNAWMIVFNRNMNLEKYAQSGLEKIFTPLGNLLEKGRLTDCAKRVLAQTGVLVTEDPSSECKDCPLSGNYIGRAAMTVRLEFTGRVYGILTVSSPKHFAHDREEQKLLSEIANDIAYALNRIEIEDDRIRIEKSLQESEQGIHDLVENSLIGICIIQDDEIIYRNPEQQRLLGSASPETSPFDFENIHPDDVKKVKTLYQNLVTGQAKTQQTNYRFYPPGKMHSKADMKWVYCRSSLIKYKGEQAILVNLLDITKAKELEHLLLIKDKMVSLGHMAAGIAHEIRNPLSGINIYLNTLEKLLHMRDSVEKEIEIVQRAQSASNKIESVIRRVMDFSKPSEPKLILKDINEPVEEALNLSLVTMRKRGIKIGKSLDDKLPYCYIDPPLIEEVVLNLITNAADAMRANTEDKIIRVISSRRQNSILLRVADSGPGVPQHIRYKVFDPFFTTKSDSSGIGLSISHRIISDHGGSIDIDVSDLGGAEFTIEIPIPKNGQKND